MTFRDALGRHLLAIHERDLKALGDTLAEDLVLIMSDGRLVQGWKEFLELHRGWFAMKNWNLDVKNGFQLLNAFAVMDLLFLLW